MTIHLVSFQVPWPADYGGVIDVYYKLKALHDAGARIVLHAFCYKGRSDSDRLREVADEVYLYERKRSVRHLFSRMPFMVRSRMNDELLKRLAEVPQGDMIIFEGLHTTAYLAHPALRDKFKVVRTHNVEHEYYTGLANATNSFFKRLFYKREADRLRDYEPVLNNADAIIAISEKDCEYFSEKYGREKVKCVNCFYKELDTGYSSENITDEERALVPEKTFMLYHGNLTVAENINVALYIIRELLHHIPGNSPLIIAGFKPDDEILHAAREVGERVMVIDTPSDALLAELLAKAKVNLMFTFQPTGIKLKLINALNSAPGAIVANSDMVNDSRIKPLCFVSDTVDGQAELIGRFMKEDLSQEDLEKRRRVIRDIFSPEAGAKSILNLLG